uniref:Uncharacterized protein n=1 Tax=Catharus ustulatus TaxID=91951 RepID=A0A8C3UBB9_CATUS
LVLTMKKDPFFFLKYFAVLAYNTDEYRPPVWKSYCKYFSVLGFFFQIRTEKVSVGCFKRLISLFIRV